jgi:hypothetical protein
MSDPQRRGGPLGGRILDQLLRHPPEGLTLIAIRGARLRFRAESEPAVADAWIAGRVREAFRSHLGFPAAGAIANA